MFRAFLAALAAATTAAVLAAPAPAPAEEPSGYPTIAVSDPSVKLGKKVVVSGEGPSLRHLVLQLRTDENGWQKVAGTVTGLDGDYAFLAPGWAGTHRLRVVAPAALVVNQEVSRTVSVTVRMPYRPKGPRSDWTWLSHRGARWDPCRPITYRVNPRAGYPSAAADVRSAFAAVGRVTGFRFRYLGTTKAQVKRHQHGVHPSGTDVVVDWQGPRQDADLARGVAGIGGHWVLGERRFDGYMVLDQSERLPRPVWRQVMTHEIGHILGIGHAHSRTQLMYGTSTALNRIWGRGDLQALRRVGASRGCLAAPGTERPAVGTGPVHSGGA